MTQYHNIFEIAHWKFGRILFKCSCIELVPSVCDVVVFTESLHLAFSLWIVRIPATKCRTHGIVPIWLESLQVSLVHS